MENPEIATLEQPVKIEINNRGITIGLPANPSQGDRRFPLTPEAVHILVNDYGFKVLMEKGAGHEIHYNDYAYSSHGATITDRTTSLGADIVIVAAQLSSVDIKSMRRNATLWTVVKPALIGRTMLEALNRQAITTLSLTALSQQNGHKPIADLLAEVDGRATIAVAAGHLADGVHGKGILLGGVAGITPCEVVVIGAGTAGIAASRSALGLGAMVRLFDDDACRLRNALGQLSGAVIGSSMHRKVYLSALQSADVIINTFDGDKENNNARVNSDEISQLKKGVILFDLGYPVCETFPSLPVMDLSPATETLPVLSQRICFINTGSAVPRTSAMALSNALVPILQNLAISSDHTFMDAVRMNPFLSSGLVTFGGKLISREASLATGLKWVDPSIYLHLS